MTTKAKLRVVLFADETIVAESDDVDLWRRLVAQLTPSKATHHRQEVQRWRGAILSSSDRRLADAILLAVAKDRHIPGAMILGKRRQPVIVAARAIAMYLMREHGLSYPTIGSVFLRHHTTIMAAVAKVEARLVHDVALISEVDTLKEKVQVLQ